jgi:Xaa-Pro dipeptidase
MLLNRDLADEIMDREGLDAIVAVGGNNVFYLSDYQTDFLFDVPWVACAILPRSRDIAPCLCVTEIEAAVLLNAPSWMPDVRYYYFGLFGGVLPVHTFAEGPLSGEDAAIREIVRGLEARPYSGVGEAASAAIREMGLGKARIGFDDVRFAGMLGDAFSGTVADASNLLLECRMVKTEDEIAILKEAARRNERAMRKAFGAIVRGATWEDVNRAYEVAVAEEDGRVYASFNGAGRKSAGATRPDRAYPIEPGDQICFDSMMKFNRYMGDAQRTVVLGEASPKLERYWSAYAAGIEAAYDSLKPGVSTGKLREICIDTVRKNGLPSFELAFSHGIGLDHIEVPFIAGGTLGDFIVQENMVLNIDMELHEIGWGGVFFEETMRVTANGAERLYDLPRDLIRL